MASASGTPQAMLYKSRGSVPSNRDRSFEQRSTNSGNPMYPIFNTTYPTQGAQYGDFYGGQAPNLGRYTPPTISNPSQVGSPQWNNNVGGYAYNLPNAYGGYQGVGLFNQQNWLQNYLRDGGPRRPVFSSGSTQPSQGQFTTNPAQNTAPTGPSYTQPFVRNQPTVPNQDIVIPRMPTEY